MGARPRGARKARGERGPERQQGQISLDFLFGITLFLFTFTYVALYLPGLFAPFESESDVTTLQGDRTAIWLVEEKLVDDKSKPGIVNLSKLRDFMSQLGGTDSQKTLLREEAGLLSAIRSLDLNVSVDWLNGTVNSSGNATPSGRPVGQTRRVVKLVEPAYNESARANHLLIDQVFNSSSADAVVLFNPLPDPVDAGGYVLGDGEQNVTFPNRTLLAPRGYLTILRGTGSSFVPGCTPDLEIVQSGVTNRATVPDAVNLTGGTFRIDSGDEICLWDRNGPTARLVDAIDLGPGGSATCGSLSLGTDYPPATSGLAVRRIQTGVEGSETAETGEEWSRSFAAVAPSCPTTSAVISVRVW